MDKKEIKDYLKRVDKLLDKLKEEDKETLSWLIYGYNQCAKLLNETQKENEKLKAELQLYQGALKREHEAIHRVNDLEKFYQELKEDISFCLHSIKQEMEMSTDSRTKSEMTSCYEILKRWNK